MNLGDLNESVAILEPTVVGQSTTGEDLVSWSTLDHWPVNIQALNGAERLGVSDAPTSVDVYRVTGRYRDDLRPTMRLRRDANLTIEIASVPNQPRSMWTVVVGNAVARTEAEIPPTAVVESFVQTDFIQ